MTIRLQTLIWTMLACMLSVFHSHAQTVPVITVTVPAFEGELPNDLFNDFETQYEVEVYVNADATAPYLSSPVGDVQQHLDDLRAYAESGDVVYVNSYTLNGIGAQTGFFLDLNPLVSSDALLNPADFYEPVWNAFQWDGQLLALPVSFDTIVLAYNQTAFDELALQYPNGNWTIDTFATTVRALAQYDAAGNVIRPGYESSYFDIYLIHALAGNDFLDTSQIPAIVNVNDPELVNVLTIWNQLRAEGVIGAGDNMANTVSTMTMFSSNFFNGSSASAATLPGNRAGLDVSAYAVSRGTAYPEIAYALTRYLTEQSSIVDLNFQTFPARNTLSQGENFDATLTASLSVTMPYSDMRYADYLRSLLSVEDVNTSLETVSLDIQNAGQIARDFGLSTGLTMVQAPVSGDGIVLEFGVASSILPLPNQTQWDLAVQEFIASDSEIGWVNVSGGMGLPESYPATYDCFVQTSTQIHQLDSTQILRIDPLMMSDVTLNRDDFLPGVLESVDNNGEVYAYPLSIAPRLLAFDTMLLNNQGIQVPQNGWDITQFTNTVTQYQQTTGSPAYALDDSIDVLTLVAAYGGLPIDYRSNPPAVGFTSANNVEAILQVLDLARNGTLAYSSTATLTPMGEANTATPIQNIYLLPTGGGLMPENAGYVNFPSGRDYTVASYNIVAGAISAQTQYAEACYRWLSFVSQQGYIFQSLPVRHSVSTQTQHPASPIYTEVLQQSSIVNIPYVRKVGNDDRFVLTYLLNVAMDNYVLNGADLSTELQTAQNNADAYRQCRAGGSSVQDCALSIQPAIETVLR